MLNCVILHYSVLVSLKWHLVIFFPSFLFKEVKATDLLLTFIKLSGSRPFEKVFGKISASWWLVLGSYTGQPNILQTRKSELWKKKYY